MERELPMETGVRESAGMKMPECIWGEAYKRLKEGIQKGGIEVHAMG